MPEKKNALAELAEQLKYHDCQNDDFYPAVEKAQCIIEELAKVEFYWNGAEMWPMHDYEAVQALANIRAIAEEGARDGRQES